MKYFLDTEFIEDGQTIDLISIGLVSDDGRTFYRQNVTCNFGKANDWVWRNVFPHLQHFHMKGGRQCQGISVACSMSNQRHSHCENDCPWRTRYEIRDELKLFLDPVKHGEPEIWGYYADYDWVAFCQLFGTMTELPKGFPMYCRDIKQLLDEKGNPKIPKPCNVHNALEDAIWTKGAYEFIVKYEPINLQPV